MIVALPAACAVTRPLLETVAAFGSLLDHVTIKPVRTLPLESFTVVVSCAVVPCVSDTDEGATATLAADTPATVTLTFVFFLPADAVTVVVPVETPVTNPVPLTVASDGSPDDQDTVVDIDCPCAFRTLAVSCAVCFG